MFGDYLLIFLNLLYLSKNASGSLWQPFEWNTADVISSEAISEELFETDPLCVAWMDTHTDANVVCYREDEKRCLGYDIDVHFTGTVDIIEGWTCFSKFKETFFNLA